MMYMHINLIHIVKIDMIVIHVYKFPVIEVSAEVGVAEVMRPVVEGHGAGGFAGPARSGSGSRIPGFTAHRTFPVAL
jgi:hypothetical protein